MSAAAAGTTAAPRWPRRGVLLTLLAISLLLNVFFIAGAAWTRLHAPPAWPGFEQRFRQMAAELDLDAQQRVSFDKYVAAMRGRGEKMRQQVDPLMAEAWQEIAKPQPDGAQVRRLFDEAAEQRQTFQREATAATIEFLSVLSPEQRGKFVAIMRQRRAAWHRAHPDKH